MFLILSSLKRQILTKTLPNLLIGNIHIKREHVKTFSDEKLSWKQHIDIVSSRVSKSIGIFYKSRDVLSKQSLKQLHFSFIHNYVNYTNIAWSSTSKSNLNVLIVLRIMLLV